MMKQSIASSLILTAAFAFTTPAAAAPHPEQLLAPLLQGSVSTSDRIERAVAMENRARIIAAMEENYGAPITRRDGTLVWDIENEKKGAGRAPIVSVMMSIEKTGETVVIIDDRATRATSKTDREALSRKRVRPQSNRPTTRSLSTRNRTISDESDLPID